MFLIISTIVDIVADCAEHMPSRTVYTAYSSLLCSFIFKEIVTKSKKAQPLEVGNNISDLKLSLKYLFIFLQDENLFTLNFPALINATGSVTGPGDILVLDTSDYKPLSSIIKRFQHGVSYWKWSLERNPDKTEYEFYIEEKYF